MVTGHKFVDIDIVRDTTALRTRVQQWHDAGLTVGLIPTMGALHAGHHSLVDLLATHCDRLIVSIFVNPTQFAAHEDLTAYPRDEGKDIAQLSGRAHLVYLPPLEEIYPTGYATRIIPDGVALELEGAHRPHFFTGVATIVAKLCLQSQADAAIFGEKDYQQLLVIRQLVRDLDIPIMIHAAPIIRDTDGLAMSSRNAYLTPKTRAIARTLPQILGDLATNRAKIDIASQQAHDMLLAAGFDMVDYATIRDSDTLTLPDSNTQIRRALIAARVAGVRLIDNMIAA